MQRCYEYAKICRDMQRYGCGALENQPPQAWASSRVLSGTPDLTNQAFEGLLHRKRITRHVQTFDIET